MGKYFIIALALVTAGFFYWLYIEVKNMDDGYPFK